jgi:hypothetical protein
MREYLPVGQGSQFIQETDFTSLGVRTRPGPLHRKGDARSQKLKVVCIACNNGWMSELQDRTKPILLPLLSREAKSLAEWDQHALAVWLTMFTMIYETTIPEYAATTVEQRIAFKALRHPPENWIFWCAPFDGGSSPAAQTGFSSKSRSIVSGDDSTSINKASLTICGAGAVSFAIFGVNSADAFQAFSQFVTRFIEWARFVQLWPTTGRAIQVTDGRLSPTTWMDFLTIRDAIRDSIGVAYRSQNPEGA